MKKLIIALVALSASLSSEAQIVKSESRIITSHTTAQTVVVTEGYENYSRLSANYTSLSYGDEDTVKPTFPGIELAWDHGYNLANKKMPLYLEVGLHAQYNSADVETRYGDENYKHIEVSIPLSLTYKYSWNGLYAAPFAGINLKSAFIDDVADYMEDQKFFQVGYQVGLNFGYKALNVQIGYKGDIMPVCGDAEYSNGELKTSAFFVGLGINI